MFTVTPSSYDQTVVLVHDITVTYMAVDFNNNTSDVCAVRIRIKGELY